MPGRLAAAGDRTVAHRERRRRVRARHELAPAGERLAVEERDGRPQLRRRGGIDADRGPRAGDDHEPGRGQGRERDGPDAGCDERTLALPGGRRADHDLGDECVPRGGNRRDGGLRGMYVAHHERHGSAVA